MAAKQIGTTDTPSTDSSGVAASSNNDQLDGHLVEYMRVALAVAIIRTKPPGQTAQSYTEQLCLRYRHAQLSWRQNAHKLQAELTLLKQQLEVRQQEKVCETSDESQVFPTPPCSSDDPNTPKQHQGQGQQQGQDQQLNQGHQQGQGHTLGQGQDQQLNQGQVQGHHQVQGQSHTLGQGQPQSQQQCQGQHQGQGQSHGQGHGLLQGHDGPLGEASHPHGTVLPPTSSQTLQTKGEHLQDQRRTLQEYQPMSGTNQGLQNLLCQCDRPRLNQGDRPLSSQSGSQSEAEMDVWNNHGTFLQSVLTLSSITTHDGDHSTPNSQILDPVFEQTALESVECTLITLGDVLTHPVPLTPVISHKMLLHMVQVLVNLVEPSNRFSHWFREAVSEKILCFTWGVMCALLGNNDLTDSNCERLSELILMLSRSPSLRTPIVRMLTTQIVQVAGQLRHVPHHRGDDKQPLLQASYYVFHSLELALEAEILRSDRCLSIEACTSIQADLDQCTRDVWQRYGPFTQYVWHILGLLHCLHPNLAQQCQTLGNPTLGNPNFTQECQTLGNPTLGNPILTQGHQLLGNPTLGNLTLETPFLGNPKPGPAR